MQLNLFFVDKIVGSLFFLKTHWVSLYFVSLKLGGVFCSTLWYCDVLAPLLLGKAQIVVRIRKNMFSEKDGPKAVRKATVSGSFGPSRPSLRVLGGLRCLGVAHSKCWRPTEWWSFQWLQLFSDGSWSQNTETGAKVKVNTNMWDANVSSVSPSSPNLVTLFAQKNRSLHGRKSKKHTAKI